MPEPSAKSPSNPANPKGVNTPHGDTVGKAVEKSITGEDAPMEYEHPTSPGAVVWFTYPAVLIVVLLIGIAVMAWWNSASQAVAP